MGALQNDVEREGSFASDTTIAPLTGFTGTKSKLLLLCSFRYISPLIIQFLSYSTVN